MVLLAVAILSFRVEEDVEIVPQFKILPIIIVILYLDHG
jgi:hypothetical protein